MDVFIGGGFPSLIPQCINARYKGLEMHKNTPQINENPLLEILTPKFWSTSLNTATTTTTITITITVIITITITITVDSTLITNH